MIYFFIALLFFLGVLTIFICKRLQDFAKAEERIKEEMWEEDRMLDFNSSGDEEL